MINKNMIYLFKNSKIKIFFNIETMSNQIDLGHPATLVIDFNEFNNFIIFINYFYDKIKCLQNQTLTLKTMFI